MSGHTKWSDIRRAKVGPEWGRDDRIPPDGVIEGALPCAIAACPRLATIDIRDPETDALVSVCEIHFELLFNPDPPQ